MTSAGFVNTLRRKSSLKLSFFDVFLCEKYEGNPRNHGTYLDDL